MGYDAGMNPTTSGAAATILHTATPEAIVEAAAITPTKPTKAVVGTILGAITTGAVAAAATLPEPYAGYVTAAVAIVGIIAQFWGIYLPTNKASAGRHEA